MKSRDVCIYSTRLTLLLSDHSVSSTVVLNASLYMNCASLQYDNNVMNASTQYTVNPPTVLPFSIAHSGFEWYITYASLQLKMYEVYASITTKSRGKCIHSTRLTLLLFDHSVLSIVVLNHTYSSMQLGMYEVYASITTKSRGKCIHSTRLTLLLFDHSVLSIEVLNHTYSSMQLGMYVCIYTLPLHAPQLPCRMTRAEHKRLNIISSRTNHW